MTKIVKGARFVSKITNVTGVVPTIPNGDDHTLGWSDTDIYEGEWFFNTADHRVFFRSDEDEENKFIDEVVVLDPITKTISGAYLPSNLAGAMLYKGTWDASSGTAPGISIGITESLKGDYYIVSVSGNYDLNGITDWVAGDFAVYNGNGRWDKIDNTEPTIYADSVVYDYSSYPTLTNVGDVLNKFLDEQYTSDDTFTISNSTTNKTLLQLNGSDNDKWISWDGHSLKMGTSGYNDTTLRIGGKGSTSGVVSSNLYLDWVNNSSIAYKRWRINTTNTDGYIAGYDNDGSTEMMKFSINSSSYINNSQNFGFGISTPEDFVHVSYDGSDVAMNVERTSTSTSSVYNILKIKHKTSSTAAAGFGSSLTFNMEDNSGNDYPLAKLSGVRTDNDDTGKMVLGIYNDGAEHNVLTISNLQRVGIKNLSPTKELDVTGDANISGTLTTNTLSVSASASISQGLTVGTTSTFTGKASYNNYSTVTINNNNDITHKHYVDNEIFLRGVGHWLSGSTFNTTTRQLYAAYAGATYYVGVNKTNPAYNLDVTGSGNFTTTLNVGSNLTVNNDLIINNNLTVNGDNITFGQFNSPGLMTIANRGIRITSRRDDTHDMTMKFFNATTGDIIIGMEPTNANNYKLEIVGTDRTDSTKGGDVYIRGGNSTSGSDGDVYISNTINDTYEIVYNYPNTGDLEVHNDVVTPDPHNFINLNYKILDTNAEYNNTLNIYLSNMQFNSYDFNVTLNGYVSLQAFDSTLTIRLNKGSTGTNSLLVISGSPSYSVTFTALLSWNHITDTWTINSLRSEGGTSNILMPNGYIV